MGQAREEARQAKQVIVVGISGIQREGAKAQRRKEDKPHHQIQVLLVLLLRAFASPRLRVDFFSGPLRPCIEIVSDRVSIRQVEIQVGRDTLPCRVVEKHPVTRKRHRQRSLASAEEI